LVGFQLPGSGDDPSTDETLAQLGFPALPPEPARRPIQPAVRRGSRLIRGLVVFNAMHDRILGRLGSLGRTVATRQGRNFLGWVGVVLFFGSLALCVGSWFGWTR
jgi:hypothetical protein